MTTTTTALTCADVDAQIAELERYAKAKSTARVYRSMIDRYMAWLGTRADDERACAGFLIALDAEGKATATLAVAVAALSTIYPQHAPVMRATLGALKRRRAARAAGDEPTPGVAGNDPHRKTPITLPALAAMIEHANTRDRALVLLLFWGAFRRAEVAALRVGDVRPATGGIVLRVGRSKTDQTGAGMDKPIAARSDSLCAVTALSDWLRESGITAGPIFPGRDGGALDGQTVALIVKRLATAAGLDGDYSGHSGRRGFVTHARKAGARDDTIMKVTGHKSVATLRVYDGREHDDVIAQLGGL